MLKLIENDAILKQVVGAILGVRSELMRRLDGLHRMVWELFGTTESAGV